MVPPSPGEVETTETFKEEHRKHSGGTLGTLALGDLNVHNPAWLHFSRRNTPEGTALEETCQQLGLRQKVREPTRSDSHSGNEYLLDLALTDLEDVRCEVGAKVSDHKVVKVTLKLTMPKQETVVRKVWDFKKADWNKLQQRLCDTKWNFLDTLDPDRGAEKLTETLLKALKEAVPERTLYEKKTTHPWLTEKAVQLVAAKHAAEGTEKEQEAVEECSAGLLEEYLAYVERVRGELATLKPGSKKFWTKCTELQNQKKKTCSVPALKDTEGLLGNSSTGKWCTTAEDKANLLAKTFATKYKLAAEVTNEYSALEEREEEQNWEFPGEETALKVLKALHDESATGPDLVPTRFLHHCATELAAPLLKLARRILDTGRWPEFWLLHWVIPLYKKKAVWSAENYRGVHLTSQLAKATERLLQRAFGSFLYSTPVAGANQFAYRPERGARDVLAYLVLTWVLGFNNKEKFGVHCADVSGAFDRVRTDRLLAKLEKLGVPKKWLKVFASWLRARPAKVAVGGTFSEALGLLDMVFQGTVWGPQLWNSFFGDASKPVRKCGFEEIVYADDLNGFKAFPRNTPNKEVLTEVARCKEELQRWGQANSVTFDSGKESAHVLCKDTPEGEELKALGILFDGKLTMTSTVKEMVSEAQRRIRVLERSASYFEVAQLLTRYKARVLSYLEYRTAAVYHATDTVIEPLDRVQTSFLKKLGVEEVTALVEFRLAPLSCRRDMAMLGLIHRAVLKKGSEHFQRFFYQEETRKLGTRLAAGRHKKQLADYRKCRFLEILRRSALGLVAVYNLLPPELVATGTVREFQTQLQNYLTSRAVRGCHDWKDTFSPRVPLWRHHLSKLTSRKN